VGERYKKPRYTGIAAESPFIFKGNISGVRDDCHTIEKIEAARVEKNNVDAS